MASGRLTARSRLFSAITERTDSQDEAIGEKPVGIVRRWFDAHLEGRLAVELCAPEVIVDNVPEFPITGPYHGHDGLQRWWDELSEVVESAHIYLDEAEPIDEERVLTIQRLVGSFSNTGIPVDQPWAAIFVVREGKISRVSGYATRGRAVRAAGAAD